MFFVPHLPYGAKHANRTDHITRTRYDRTRPQRMPGVADLPRIPSRFAPTRVFRAARRHDERRPGREARGAVRAVRSGPLALLGPLRGRGPHLLRGAGPRGVRLRAWHVVYRLYATNDSCDMRHCQGRLIPESTCLPLIYYESQSRWGLRMPVCRFLTTSASCRCPPSRSRSRSTTIGTAAASRRSSGGPSGSRTGAPTTPSGPGSPSGARRSSSQCGASRRSTVRPETRNPAAVGSGCHAVRRVFL